MRSSVQFNPLFVDLQRLIQREVGDTLATALLAGSFGEGDKVTVDWDTQCACGRTTAHLSSRIERYSELQGGGDKINCAGSRAAHGEAMDYLVSLNA